MAKCVRSRWEIVPTHQGLSQGLLRGQSERADMVAWVGAPSQLLVLELEASSRNPDFNISVELPDRC